MNFLIQSILGGVKNQVIGLVPLVVLLFVAFLVVTTLRIVVP